MPARKHRKKHDYYFPHEKVKEFLADKLRIEKMKKEGIDAADKTLVAVRQITFLSTIFQSMANIVYFFEFINKNKDVMNSIFDDEIGELLLGKNNLSDKEIKKLSLRKSDFGPNSRYAFVFDRLVHAIITDEPDKDYQLEIINSLQKTLYHRFMTLVPMDSNEIAQAHFKWCLAYVNSTITSKSRYEPKDKDSIHRRVLF